MEDKVAGLFENEDPCIEVFSGEKFHLLSPWDSVVDVVDIAHSLSQLCRFAGHTSQFYSVAEHSVRVSDIVPQEQKMAALFHDAAEAYIGDISRPLKLVLAGSWLGIIEDRIRAEICVQLHIFPMADTRVKWADNVLLYTEGRDLMNNSSQWHFPAGIQPLKDRIIPWTADEAMIRFLCSYDALKQE